MVPQSVYNKALQTLLLQPHRPYISTILNFLLLPYVYLQLPTSWSLFQSFPCLRCNNFPNSKWSMLAIISDTAQMHLPQGTLAPQNSPAFILGQMTLYPRISSCLSPTLGKSLLIWAIRFQISAALPPTWRVDSGARYLVLDMFLPFTD